MTLRRPLFFFAWLLLGFTLKVAARAAAPDPTDAQRELLAGNYAFVIEHGTAALRDPAASADWLPVLVRAQLATGHTTAAASAVADALNRDGMSIKLRWLAREVALAS